MEVVLNTCVLWQPLPGMDPLAIREDIWRLHDEMKLLHSAQAETAERLSKVERRQEDDARLKSVWGASSPFPGVLSGTPQQGRPGRLDRNYACLC